MRVDQAGAEIIYTSRQTDHWVLNCWRAILSPPTPLIPKNNKVIRMLCF